MFFLKRMSALVFALLLLFSCVSCGVASPDPESKEPQFADTKDTPEPSANQLSSTEDIHPDEPEDLSPADDELPAEAVAVPQTPAPEEPTEELPENASGVTKEEPEEEVVIEKEEEEDREDAETASPDASNTPAPSDSDHSTNDASSNEGSAPQPPISDEAPEDTAPSDDEVSEEVNETSSTPETPLAPEPEQPPAPSDTCDYCQQAGHTYDFCSKRAVANGALGRWIIPDVGINVACYSSWEQSVTDAKDSANYMAYFNGIYLIGDHNYQGFNGLYHCTEGMHAYMDRGETLQEYVCVAVIPNGSRSSNQLLDESGTPLENVYPRGSFVCYTCNYLINYITIVVFQPV